MNKIATLNVNGLNCQKKQQILFDFIQTNGLNIIGLQEHNLKQEDVLMDIFYDNFHVIINESINIKGGTAILIDKRLTDNILQVEKSSDSRIISAKITVGSDHLHILNIYAPSGTKQCKDRENLFKNEIIYYLRNNLSNTIILGDFNCITNCKDASKIVQGLISKNLQNLINKLKFVDIWNVFNNEVNYTYFRENYGSRLDRIYAGEFKKNFTSIKTLPMSISDHHCVIANLNLKTPIRMGKGHWKLNINLLELPDIEAEFKVIWDRLCTYKKGYNTLNDWWENCAKRGIGKFFKKKGKENSKLSQGLIKYLEIKLHKLYQNMHVNGSLDMTEVNRLKSKINTLKESILEGIKIRARVKEQVEGEKPSVSLLGKQNKSKFKPIFTQIKTEQCTKTYPKNEILTSQESISEYITEYFENIYQNSIIDVEKQEWFLSFIKPSIDECDNRNLTRSIEEDEILFIIKSFSLNKSPGIDGLPIEFYLKIFNIIKNDLCKMINNCFLGHGYKDT